MRRLKKKTAPELRPATSGLLNNGLSLIRINWQNVVLLFCRLKFPWGLLYGGYRACYMLFALDLANGTLYVENARNLFYSEFDYLSFW